MGPKNHLFKIFLHSIFMWHISSIILCKSPRRKSHHIPGVSLYWGHQNQNFFSQKTLSLKTKFTYFGKCQIKLKLSNSKTVFMTLCHLSPSQRILKWGHFPFFIIILFYHEKETMVGDKKETILVLMFFELWMIKNEFNIHFSHPKSKISWKV